MIIDFVFLSLKREYVIFATCITIVLGYGGLEGKLALCISLQREPGTYCGNQPPPIRGLGLEILELVQPRLGLVPKFLGPVQLGLRLVPKNWTGYLVLLTPNCDYLV